MCSLVSKGERRSLGLGPELMGSLQDFKGPSLQVFLLKEKSALPGKGSVTHQLTRSTGVLRQCRFFYLLFVAFCGCLPQRSVSYSLRVKKGDGYCT